MLRLTYNDCKPFNFSRKLIKISTYVESMVNEYGQGTIIPIMCKDHYIFEIFNEWFKNLKEIGITKIPDKSYTVIFMPEYFEEYNIYTLIDIFNFALSNQILLLCDTIAYVIGLSYDVGINDDQICYIYNGSNCININIILLKMILKNMDNDKFWVQNNNVIELINNTDYVIDYYNYMNIPEDMLYLFDCHQNNICQSEFTSIELTKVKLPDRITKINNRGFNRCTKLSKIILSNQLEYIGVIAFENCKNLKYLAMPKNLKIIDEYAFHNCFNLREITIYDQEYLKINVGAFSNCYNLKFVNIDNTCIDLDNAFENCKKLTTIDVSKSVIYTNNDIYNNLSRIINLNLSYIYIYDYTTTMMDKLSKLLKIKRKTKFKRIIKNNYYGLSKLKDIDM